jgi:hypothetical protein
MNPAVTELALYDVVNVPGVAADVSHINTKAVVKVRHFKSPRGPRAGAGRSARPAHRWRELERGPMGAGLGSPAAPRALPGRRATRATMACSLPSRTPMWSSSPPACPASLA